MSFDLDALYYLSAGMYLYVTIALGLGLAFRIFQLNGGGAPTPPMRLMGLGMLLDVLPTTAHALQRWLWPEYLMFFEHFYILSDLLITTIFVLAMHSLGTSKYPSRKESLSVLLPALAIFVVYELFLNVWVFNILTMLWLVSIVLWAFVVMRRHDRMLYFHYSNVESRRTTWLVYVLLWAFVVYPMYELVLVNDKYADVVCVLYSVSMVAVYAVVSRFIFVHTCSSETMVESLGSFDTTIPSTDAEAEQPSAQVKKYFSDSQLRQMKDTLRQLMEEEKLYRDPDLCVDSLVKRMGTNASYFYYFMRDVIGASFFDYVNEYRINEAKQLLLQGEKVDAVAEQVGYNSSNVFRRVFKKMTNMTPSEWRKNQG